MAGENINRKLNIYINDKEVVNSLSGITREIGKTRNELKNLNKNSVDYDADVARLTKHLSDLNEKQTEFKEELKLTNKEMGAARENFSNLLGGLASGDMQAVQTGMLAIRGSIVATTQAAWAFVATPVGAFIAIFAGLGLAAKQVVDFNESIKESNQLLDNLGVDSKLRPAIQGIADTFKVGFEQIAKSIDDMVDLELVKDEFEALDKIKEGLVEAPDKNGFLSMLQSNGVAAKNLGLQLEDVISLNESFEATGANAEAIFGALQKSSSTLILQSPQLKKSMESAFGAAFTSDLLAQVKSGSITYYEALERIYVKGEEIGISNQKQAQLAKDLFGKSAIAAGGYEMILGNVATSHGKNTKALTETQKQTQALAESNVELAEAQDNALKSDGYNKWKNNALIALNAVQKGFFNLVAWITNSEEAIRNTDLTNAKSSGKTDGKKSFNTQFKSLAGTGTDEEVAARIKEAAEREYKFYEKAYKENNNKINALTKKIGFRDNFGSEGSDLNEKQKELAKSLHQQAEIIRQAREKINPTKPKNTNAKGQSPDGIPEDEQKAADAAAKKLAKSREDAEKRSEALKTS